MTAVHKNPPEQEPDTSTGEAATLQGERVLRMLASLSCDELSVPNNEPLRQQISEHFRWLRLVDLILATLAQEQPHSPMEVLYSRWQEQRQATQAHLAALADAIRDFYWSPAGQPCMVALAQLDAPATENADVAGYLASLSPEELEDYRRSLAHEQKLADDHAISYPDVPYDPAV